MGIEETIGSIMDDELSRAIAEKNSEISSGGQRSDMPSAKAPEKGHRSRVRDRFLQTGLDGFAPHEILELLLFYAVPMRDTKKTAHELIDRFGSIAGVFNAEVSELTKIPYITENAAILFKLIPPLISAYYAEESKGVSYNDTTKLASLFRPYFVGSGSSKFLLACFDRDLHMISVTEISRGSSVYTSIEMRKILSETINSGCVMAALAHNHPQANPRPSEEDVAVTRRIGELLAAVDVKLMDHIIVGGSMTYSMRDGGELGIFD
ncbi:MAG: RadC family protein [Oscillospiraceae bacterium]|nr:RadC family protein [Oscillospiraceae bacterium]